MNLSNFFSNFLYMQSLDNMSMASLALAGGIIAADMMDVSMPVMVSSTLSNQMFQVVLGVGVVVAAYYHLPTAIVLAAVLYVSLNQQAESVKPSSEDDEVEETEQSGSHTTLSVAGVDVNNTGVPGVPSEPSMEPVENPLPTQDNSAPKETATNVVEAEGEPADPTLVNKEDLEKVSGFGGNDMAPTI